MKPTDFTTSLEIMISNLLNNNEKLILMGDLNMTLSNPILSQFLDTLALSSLNIEPTSFKNSKNPSCIDLLLTSFKPSFMKRNIFETGISDHHKMISTTLNYILLGKILKQNTFEITINFISITLFPNSLVN